MGKKSRQQQIPQQPANQPATTTPQKELSEQDLSLIRECAVWLHNHWPEVDNLHQWAFKGLMLLFIGHLMAGVAAFFIGPLAMIIVETAIMMAIWFLGTNPALLAAEMAAAGAIAGQGPEVISKEIPELFEKWFKWVNMLNAYVVVIPMTVMLLLDIKLGADSMIFMVFLGLMIATISAALGYSGRTALEIAFAGLIGALVKTILPLVGTSEGITGTIRDTFVSHSTLIGVITALSIYFGWKTITSGPKGFVVGIWNWLTWKKVILVVVALIAWAYFMQPQWIVEVQGLRKENMEEAMKTASEKGVAAPPQILSPNASDQVTTQEQQAQQQAGQGFQPPVFNENDWVKVGEKTCEVGWETKDSHEGWCALGTFDKGEYRVVLKTSTAGVHWQDGVTTNIPMEGFLLDDFSQSPELQEYFRNFLLVRNGKIGEVIIKEENGSPIDAKGSIALAKKTALIASLNFPTDKGNWEKPGNVVYGEIYLHILRKK